jgi:hypothetical protein
MKKRTFVSLIILIALSLPFTYGGCGGGGGGGGGDDFFAPATPQTFHLSPDGSDVPGYKLSFSLKGTSSAGENIEALFLIQTKPIISISGQDVLPQEIFIEMTFSDTGGAISEISTTYYDAVTKDPVKRIDQSTGVEYTPITISKLPDLAEIGDFGTITSWKSSDGSTMTGTWRLEDAGGGLANLIVNITTQDSSGNILYTGKETVTIDVSGDPSKLKMVLYYLNHDLRVVLSGSI